MIKSHLCRSVVAVAAVLALTISMTGCAGSRSNANTYYEDNSVESGTLDDPGASDEVVEPEPEPDPQTSFVPTAREAAAVAIGYYCQDPDSWAGSVESYYLIYPDQVDGYFVVGANTAAGVFELAITPYEDYATVEPIGDTSVYIWDAFVCPTEYAIDLNYVYAEEVLGY
jgi:hypothetical protein